MSRHAVLEDQRRSMQSSCCSEMLVMQRMGWPQAHCTQAIVNQDCCRVAATLHDPSRRLLQVRQTVIGTDAPKSAALHIVAHLSGCNFSPTLSFATRYTLQLLDEHYWLIPECCWACTQRNFAGNHCWSVLLSHLTYADLSDSDHMMTAGIANAPAASSLDALWAKLQQQHSLEAEAARMSRRVNSGSIGQADNKDNASSSSTEPVQQLLSVPAIASKPFSSTITDIRPDGSTDRQSAPDVFAAPQQQLSEADFWKSMQK